MIKFLLLAIVPFMTEHRNVTPRTEVSTNFYGSVTGIVDNAYIQAHGGGGVDTNDVRDIAREEIVPTTNSLYTTLNGSIDVKRDKDDLAVYEVVRTENTDWTLTTNVVDRLATTNGVNAAIAANNVGYRVRESVAWSGAAELAMNANGVRSADETRSGAMLFDQIDGKATKTELADRYTIKSETFTNDVSAVVTNDVGRWDISGTPKAQSYYWIWFDPNLPIALLKDGNEDVSERPYTQGVKTLHFTLSYSLDPIDITARLITENALGLAYSKDIPAISATDPTFSNAVLAVGLNIDTNSVAVLNEISKTFGGFPIEGTATTVGGLLAALAAAIAWLKKNKVGSFAYVGGASATVENGVAKLSDFFTESNSLLTGTIDARLPYPLYAVPSTGILKDRAINTTSLSSVTVPENFTDLLVRTSVASSLAVTMPTAIATKYGDTFPGEAGEYLITITKTGAAEAYVRTIKLEEVANA